MPADAPIPARLVTIYSLVRSPDGPTWEVALDEEQTKEGQARGVEASYDRIRFDRWGEPYPRLAAEGLIGHYDVGEIATTLRYQEYAGWTAALQVSFSAPCWDGVIQAAKDSYDKNRVTAYLDDEKLIEQIRRLTHRPTLDFGKERAQLLVVDRLGGPPGKDFDPVNDVDQQLLRQLLFKDTDIAYRPAWAPVSMPPDINGPEGTLVAVWATSTVVSGYDRLLRTRVDEMTKRLSEAVITLEACNGVLSEAYAEITGLGEAEAKITGEPDWPSHADALRRLQYRYTFAVERHLPNMGAKGGAPIESYYEAAAGELRLVDRADTTRVVIDRLAEAARAERGRLEIVAALSRARDARITAVVAGTLGALLAAAGLFATLATIPSDHTLLHAAYRSAALAEVLVVGAGGIGVLLALAALHRRQRGAAGHRLSQATEQPRSAATAPARSLPRRWVLGAAAAAAAVAVLLAVAASGVPGNTAGWAIVAGATLVLVGALAGIVSKMTF